MLSLKEVAVNALGNLGRQETVTPKFAQLIVNGLDLVNGPSAQCHVALERNKGKDTYMLRLEEVAVIALGNLSRQETVTPKFAQLIANGLDLGNGPGAL